MNRPKHKPKHKPMKRTVLALLVAAATMMCGCERNIGQAPLATPDYKELYYSGTVRALSAPSGGILYVGAAPAEGGPAVLIARYENPMFPVQFELTERSRMSHNWEMGKDMVLIARFDQDGNVETRQPGDLAYRGATVYPLGTKDLAIDLQIDETGGADETAQGAPATVSGSTVNSSAVSLSIKGTIKGTVSTAGKTLFIIARGVGIPMPVAAIRLMQPGLPLDFHLTDDQRMMREMPVPPQVELVVRLDQDGDPLTRGEGDLEKILPAGPPVREQPVAITLP